LIKALSRERERSPHASVNRMQHRRLSLPMNNRFGDQIMKKLLIAAGIIVAGASAAPMAASAQGYVVYGPPAVAVYPAVPTPAPAYGLYDYAPVTTYGYYPPVRWYGSYDESGNSYRQPSPRSTIRAVR
jgi:hypothetical protein